MNKIAIKTTYYPNKRFGDLDPGMVFLTNKNLFDFLYLKRNFKSFPISEIQNLNKGNSEAIEIILSFRVEKVRQKILSLIQQGKVFVLYGNEHTRVFENYLLNKKITITKKTVCLLIENCTFCPGIFYTTRKEEDIVKNPSNN